MSPGIVTTALLTLCRAAQSALGIDQFPKNDLFCLHFQHIHVLNPAELVRSFVHRGIIFQQIINQFLNLLVRLLIHIWNA